jgi:hypothetical protein
MIEQRLITLRKRIRKKGKFVTDNLIKNHNSNICIICGSKNSLTKEHVIPKWIFQNDPKEFFNTLVNEIDQKFSKTTIPVCFNCNSHILGALEHYLETLFRENLNDYKSYYSDDIEKIILWFELIDYKFHVLNLRRKFLKPKNGQYIPYLSNLPISIIQNIELSPSKIYSQLRGSLKKLNIKSKDQKINSLVMFKTTNKSFHFFHKTEKFIFIELPKYHVALFYFLNQEFKNTKEAYNSAMKIIKKVY